MTSDIKPTLKVYTIRFPEKDWPKLPGKVMVSLLGPSCSSGPWWKAEDGDWHKGPAITLSQFPDAVIEPKEF